MEWGSHDEEWGRVCVGQAVRYRGHKCCSNRVSILLGVWSCGIGVWSCGIMLRLSTENGGQRDWRGYAGKTLLLHTHIIQNSMCIYTEHHTPLYILCMHIQYIHRAPYARYTACRC